MRTLCFWFGIAAAFLCGWADPAWGYAVLCVLSVVQLAMLRVPGASVFCCTTPPSSRTSRWRRRCRSPTTSSSGTRA